MEDVEIPQYVYKWYLPLCRPEMSRKLKRNVICILESGLLFKEDSLSVEETLCLRIGSRSGLFLHRILPAPCSTTEKVVATLSVLVCVAAVPITLPIGSRGNMFRLCCYAGAAYAPLALRLLPAPHLPSLLTAISHYTMLSRRHITSKIWCPVESISSMLVSQQKYMCNVIRGANVSLLGAFPWLEGPHKACPPWEDTHQVKEVMDSTDLTRIHHLLLVLQSSFLKNLALAHFPPTAYTSQYSRSNNDRVYWMHTKFIPAITHYYEYCSDMLDNAFKYYKEVTRNRDNKLSLPRFINNNRDPWQYSEVHGSVSAIGTDLRMALAKCNEMDSLLEASWTAKSKFSPEVFHEDLTKVRDNLLKCFASIEVAFVQLKKIRSAEMKLLEAAVQKLPLPSVEEESEPSANVVVVSEDTAIPVQDQVFYYEKTNEDAMNMEEEKVVDYLTGPGKNEINTTKIVLGELKVKLVKKEEEMREREAKALENTMPELKGKVPEFPKQINVDKKSDVEQKHDDLRISKFYNSNNGDESQCDGNKGGKAVNGGADYMKASSSHNVNGICEKPAPSNGKTEEFEKSNVANGCANGRLVAESNGECSKVKEVDMRNGKTVNGESSRSKKVDFLSDEYFGSSTDTEIEQECKTSLLQDVRKHRVTRKKRHPPSRSGSIKSQDSGDAVQGIVGKQQELADESLKPVEYSFGTGLAMASLLQIPQNRNGTVNLIPSLGVEEVFDGEGEVSDDSGNED